MIIDPELVELARTVLRGELRTMLATKELGEDNLAKLDVNSLDLVFLSDHVEETLGVIFNEAHIKAFIKAQTVTELVGIAASQLHVDQHAYLERAAHAWIAKRKVETE